MDNSPTTNKPQWIVDLMLASDIGLALCEIQSNYKIRDLNPGLAAITGVAREDLVDKYFCDALPCSDTPCSDRFKQLNAIGDTLKYEVYCPEIDRYFKIHGHQISTELVAIIVHDVTDQKQVESKLQRNESLFLATQRLAKVGGWELDLDNMTTYWTDEVFRIHDMEPEDFASVDEAIKLSLECYQPEDRPAVMAAFQRCAEEGVPYDQEFKFTTTKGRKTWIRTIASPVKENGKVVKVVGYLMDISDQKQMESEKLHLERQVQHAQKLESLGVLAGGIAHDFNNLLMGVIGNADLALRKMDASDPLRVYLEGIENAAASAADLAKQMLAYSGRGSFKIERVHLNELIKDTAKLLEAVISKRAVLTFRLTEGLPQITGDPTQIRQLVMNLITNASEALGDEGGEIVLSTGVRECTRKDLDKVNKTLLASLNEPLTEGLYVYMEVQDNGCGMDAPTVERIFDPFFSTKFTGRGLGMSTVLGILAGHKGAITISSKVGNGTSILALLPAELSEVEHSDPQMTVPLDSPATSDRNTVLIVDDEESVLTVAKNMVAMFGYDVLEASDGHSAIEVFRENSEKVTCLVLDFQMPEMNGLETLLAIRRISPDIKAIISSGYNEVDVTNWQDLKPVAFIQKPYRLAHLREKLSRLINEETSTSN